MTSAKAASDVRLFLGCFEFIDEESDREGTFQVVVEARSVEEAAALCRERLDELASTSAALGPVHVYVNAILELAPATVARGAIVNEQTLGECMAYNYLPKPGLGDETHFIDDVATSDGEEQDVTRPFWDGVDVYRSQWKLYWCETSDHAEDWFVVAKTIDEARAFHALAERHEQATTSAEFVCVLPPFEQQAIRAKGPHWPSNDTLVACGGVFLTGSRLETAATHTPPARVVELHGRVFGESDALANALRRVGKIPQA